MIPEPDICVREYKPRKFGHDPGAKARDCRSPGPAPRTRVQIKSLKNPDGAFGAMKKAVDDLVKKSPDNVALKLHILKKPGSGSDALETKLKTYVKDVLRMDERFTIKITPYTL